VKGERMFGKQRNWVIPVLKMKEIEMEGFGD
jgi:hypothetical protein